jgi:hypothetical protein
MVDSESHKDFHFIILNEATILVPWGSHPLVLLRHVKVSSMAGMSQQAVPTDYPLVTVDSPLTERVP